MAELKIHDMIIRISQSEAWLIWKALRSLTGDDTEEFDTDGEEFVSLYGFFNRIVKND